MQQLLQNFVRSYRMGRSVGQDDTIKCYPRVGGCLQLGKFSLASTEVQVRCFKFLKCVTVGKYCSIGRSCFVIDANHNINFAATFPFAELGVCASAPANELLKPTPSVQNDVWIGDDAYILAGVDVGDGAVVASNTVVTKNVPPFAVVAGNPGRIVKYRFEPDTIARFLQVKWWDLPDDVVARQLAPLIADPEAFLVAAENYRRNTV